MGRYGLSNTYWLLKHFEREAKRSAKEAEQKRKEDLRNSIRDTECNMEKWNQDIKQQVYNLENFAKINLSITEENKNECLNFYKSQLKQRYENIFKEEKPVTLDNFLRKKGYIEFGQFIKKLLPKVEQKNNQRKKLLEKQYEDYLSDFTNKVEKEKNNYLATLDEKNKEIDSYNNQILKREQNFISGDKAETEFLIKDNLTQIEITMNDTGEEYKIIDNLNFHTEGKILEITVNLPSPDFIKKIPKNVKLNKKTYENEYSYYSSTFYNKLYTIFTENIVLMKLFEVAYIFCDYINYIDLNAKISDINPLNGKVDKINVLSVEIPCKEFATINAKEADPDRVLRYYGAKISKDMLNLVAVSPKGYSKNNNIVPHKISIENINSNLDGFQFEYFAKDLLLSNGFYDVEVTKASGDYGADVIAYKDDVKYAVQCKKFTSPVGTKAIQEVMGSKSIYNCHVAVVLTNNYFTSNAKELAEKNNVLLWDRDKLITMLKNLKEE